MAPKKLAQLIAFPQDFSPSFETSKKKVVKARRPKGWNRARLFVVRP